MKLRTQLILALLLLAILPLGGLTFYSYQTSIQALHQAIESETMAATQEMGGRLDSMHQDLNRTVERLRNFPFRQFTEMVKPQTQPADRQNPLMQQLMSVLGNNAIFFQTLEFEPNFPIPPEPPRPPRGAKPFTPSSKAESSDQRQAGAKSRFVIERDPETGGVTMGNPADQNSNSDRPQVHFRMITEMGSPEMQAARKSAPGPEDQSGALNIPSRRRGEDRPIRRQDLLQWFRFTQGPQNRATGVSPQQGDAGQGNGTFRAEVNPQRIMNHILGISRRRPGDLPFVWDGNGNLHAAQPSDLTQLQKIPMLQNASTHSTGKAVVIEGNWVIVARKDEESGLTFGVARPIGESLLEIRRAVLRNLGLGLGIIALALAGILPLSNRMTRNLDKLIAVVDSLANGDMKARVNLPSKDEFGKLAASFNRMAGELEEHQKRLVEQERLQQELDMCRRIQEEMLPHKPLHSGPIQVKGISIPARQVGGDFFNYFALPNASVVILLGDVSGKGLPAALLMANLQAMLQARLPLQTELAKLAESLDFEIHGSTPPELYVTLFMGILEPKKNLLRYVNAGHNTQFALYQNGAVAKLESTGRPLGLLPGGPFEERSIELQSGDSLFLFTDGLVEIVNSDDEEFGTERLETLVQDCHKNKGCDLLAKVEQTVQVYRGAIEAPDDATMLLLQIEQQCL